MRHIISAIVASVCVGACKPNLEQLRPERPPELGSFRVEQLADPAGLSSELLGASGARFKGARIEWSPYEDDKNIPRAIWFYSTPKVTRYAGICEVEYAKLTVSAVGDEAGWLKTTGLKSNRAYIFAAAPGGCLVQQGVPIFDSDGAYRLKTAKDILDIAINSPSGKEILADWHREGLEFDIVDIEYFRCADDPAVLRKCYNIVARAKVQDQDWLALIIQAHLKEHSVGNVTPDDINQISIHLDKQFQ